MDTWYCGNGTEPIAIWEGVERKKEGEGEGVVEGKGGERGRERGENKRDRGRGGRVNKGTEGEGGWCMSQSHHYHLTQLMSIEEVFMEHLKVQLRPSL